MRVYHENIYHIAENERLHIVDQNHARCTWISHADYKIGEDFSIELFPAHIPDLLKAVGILMKYATPEQADNTAIALQNLLSGANAIVDAARAESEGQDA